MIDICPRCGEEFEDDGEYLFCFDCDDGPDSEEE